MPYVFGVFMVDVVLVDDDELTRTALRLLLREANFVVVGEANNGIAGFTMVERLLPEIVCLDIQMPEMDGLTLLEKIKASWPDIAVLMITASADRQSVGRALALGAAGFIVKPFNADRVVKSVRVATRLHASGQSIT